MKDRKILGYAGFYSFVMLVMMLIFIVGQCLANRSVYYMYDVIINFGFVNTVIAQLCTMGAAATGYHNEFYNGAAQFLSGMNAVAAVFYGLCVLIILLQVISMLKMRKGRKIAYRTPLLLNTLDVALHIVYLGNAATSLIMLVVKIWGEILLFGAHRYQKKELKMLKEQAKAAQTNA
ncbi:MAG: hypothetical protein E7218_04415 [Anaerofustis stercorihominis]|nr:hypothetical protein [Anaerofustis stercorihominis]